MNSAKYNIGTMKSILQDFNTIDDMFENESIHNFLLDNGFVLDGDKYKIGFYNKQLKKIVFIYVKPKGNNGMSVDIHSADYLYEYKQDYSFNQDSPFKIEDVISDMLLDASKKFAKSYREDNE